MKVVIRNIMSYDKKTEKSEHANVGELQIL